MSEYNETFNRELYNLLKTRGYNPIPKDSKNERTEPETADVFKFTFKKDGQEYGDAWVTLDDDGRVTLYSSNELEDSPDSKTPGLDYDDTWSGFRKQLKYWALTHQPRYAKGYQEFNKDRLGDDMARREYMKKKEKLEEGYYPMGKQASYNDNIPTVKIILQHTRQIQEGEQRYRNVAKIFLENTLGERILAPTIRPGIAQVYARHLAEGGVPNDERWNHIKSLCEEYSKMAGFVRATKNHQFNESAQQLVNEGVGHYVSLRETLGKLRGHRGYTTYFESWTPTLMEDESDDNTLNELFVQETMDPRIESVLPILSKLRKSVVEMKEVDELAEWADSLTEAPGDETLAHNKKTEKDRLKALDLAEDDDAVKAGQTARDKIKKPAFMRKAAGEEPVTLGDVERSQQHRSSQAMVGQKGQEVEESGLQAYTDIEMKLTQLTKAPDIFDAIYDALTGDDDLGKYLQDMYIDIARESRLHPDDDFEDIITKMADQLEDYYGKEGVAEGSNELDQQALAIADKLTTGKNLEKLRSMVHDSTVYRALDRYFAKHNVPETIYNRVAYIVFKKINQQGVAEGSEQANESLDRLLHLANINNPKKKVDESIDDMHSLSGKLPPDDQIDKVGGQDMSFDEEIRANTIKHLLQQNPSLSQDKLKELIKGKSNAELISMLREGVAEGSVTPDVNVKKIYDDGNKKEWHIYRGEEMIGYVWKNLPDTAEGLYIASGYGPDRGFTEEFTGLKSAVNFIASLDDQGVTEDLDANQKRVGQLGPTEKVKNNNIGKLVGANESVELSEMDKSQSSSDRGGESSGNPYAKGGKATPIKAKDAEKDAEKALNKSMDKAHKKDVKEGQEDLDAILRIIRK